MKTTARARIEQAVKKQQWGNELDGFFFRPEHVIKLIMAERVRLKRGVRRCQCDPEDGAAVAAGYAQAQHDILTLWEK